MARFGSATIAVALVAVACSGGKDDTSATEVECTNSVSLFPADGASNVYYRTTIEATFAEIEEGAEMTVNDGAVTGSTTWNGNTMVFKPDAPLDPSSSYTASVSYSCGAPAASWNTSDIGGSVATADVAGNAYELDISSGRFVQPPDVGELLGSYLTVPILISVTSADDADITMIGAIGVEGSVPPAQDTCEPTIDFPTADFTGNPFFEIGPQTTTISVADFAVTIDDLNVSGAFSPDGSYIDGGVLAGRIDTRPLVPLLEEGGEDSAICDLAGALEIDCEPCSDGGNYCLTIYVDSIQMDALGAPLEEIAEEDVCDRPECDCTE
jgi:hypothetical protein